MTRSELIAKLAAKNPTLYHRDIERLVATILDEVSAALERGNRVELRGFGAVEEQSSTFDLLAFAKPANHLKRDERLVDVAISSNLKRHGT